jgi:hypothetical protein
MAGCFVILPFGKTTDTHDADYWKDHFENFIKPAVEKASDGKKILGYEAVLANPPGGGIIDSVFRNLQEADVVLADLTDFNPNVVYELALRQCLQDKTIMILEKGLELPFYFKNYRIIRYSKDLYQNVGKFQEDIERILLDFSHNIYHASDNPISDYFRKTGQLVKVLSSQAPDLPTLRRNGFNAIYIPETNDQRNTSKRHCVQEAKDFIRLLASSGHAYLARVHSPFRATLEERLNAKIPVQIILVNPWSESRVLLSLGEFSDSTSSPQSIQAIVLEKFRQGNFVGFDPVELIEQSAYYGDKYYTSIRGYKDLKKRFGNLIELRICTYEVTATILLTENTGFFEPYVHADLYERMLEGMITFEVEFPSNLYLYRHCNAYFETLWQLSKPYEEFAATEDRWKGQLREKYEWKTNSPDSSA